MDQGVHLLDAEDFALLVKLDERTDWRLLSPGNVLLHDVLNGIHSPFVGELLIGHHFEEKLGLVLGVPESSDDIEYKFCTGVLIEKFPFVERQLTFIRPVSLDYS